MSGVAKGRAYMLFRELVPKSFVCIEGYSCYSLGDAIARPAHCRYRNLTAVGLKLDQYFAFIFRYRPKLGTD